MDNTNGNTGVVAEGIRSRIELGGDSSDRERVIAGVLRAVEDAIPVGAELPDMFDLPLKVELRARTKRPGAHAVVWCQAHIRRGVGVVVATK